MITRRWFLKIAVAGVVAALVPPALSVDMVRVRVPQRFMVHAGDSYLPQPIADRFKLGPFTITGYFE